MVRAAKGKVKLVKMNIDHHPEVAGQMGIRSIPAVIAFKGGQPVDGFMGALPESQIKTFIDKISAGGRPSPSTLIAEGEAALAAVIPDGVAAFRGRAAGRADNLAAILGSPTSAEQRGRVQARRRNCSPGAGGGVGRSAWWRAQGAMALAQCRAPDLRTWSSSRRGSPAIPTITPGSTSPWCSRRRDH